jgi:hypothetical protein|tara:strand:- start:732 stop:1088 length:357 start_codon:yes stop_codon:yes gene_type:complete
MTSISRRTEAEARRICDRGMSSYISDRHSIYLNRSLAYGVVGGIIPASALLITSAFLPINRLWTILPLGAGLISGFGYGIMTSGSQDPTSETEFEIVCDSLTPEEEEDESDGADQPES